MFFKASANTDILTMVAFYLCVFVYEVLFTKAELLEMCWKVNADRVRARVRVVHGISSNRLLHSHCVVAYYQ